MEIHHGKIMKIATYLSKKLMKNVSYQIVLILLNGAAMNAMLDMISLIEKIVSLKKFQAVLITNQKMFVECVKILYIKFQMEYVFLLGVFNSETQYALHAIQKRDLLLAKEFVPFLIV